MNLSPHWRATEFRGVAPQAKKGANGKAEPYRTSGGKAGKQISRRTFTAHCRQAANECGWILKQAEFLYEGSNLSCDSFRPRCSERCLSARRACALAQRNR